MANNRESATEDVNFATVGRIIKVTVLFWRLLVILAICDCFIIEISLSIGASISTKRFRPSSFIKKLIGQGKNNFLLKYLKFYSTPQNMVRLKKNSHP